MATLVLPKSEAEDILWGDSEYEVVRNELIDHGRWSLHYELIVRIGDKFYQTTYSKGATEGQDERPWEYESSVEFTEVEKYWRQVEDYRPVTVQSPLAA